MTIACAWWDESDGSKRITAIADSRAAVEKEKHEWDPLTELTVKLFSVQLRCHVLDDCLDRAHGGAWINPYFKTSIGIAFAGYCFEALSIISIVQKCLGGLVTDGTQSFPQPEKTFKFVSAVADRYFKTHRNSKVQSVQFLIFGFSPDTNSPWLGELRYSEGSKLKEEFHSDFGREGELVCIGDADVCHQIESDTTIRQIRRHAAGLSEGTGDDAQFKYELEQARLIRAERKSIEEMVLQKINSKYAQTVGGSIQKLELYPADGGAAVSAYTEDRNFELPERLPSLNDEGLQYVTVNQLMGRPSGT